MRLNNTLYALLLILSILVITGCAGARRDVPAASRDSAPPSPISIDERLTLSYIYAKKGEYVLALKVYTEAIEAGARDARLYLGRGTLYLRLKMPKEAKGDYLKAIELDPTNGAALNNLGWLYMEEGLMDKAVAYAGAALDADPANAHIFLDTMGVIKTRAGDFKGAEEALLDAVSKAPPDEREALASILAHLIELYVRTGDERSAARMEERLKGL
jgi:Tfp pilus assembly protein PilF